MKKKLVTITIALACTFGFIACNFSSKNRKDTLVDVKETGYQDGLITYFESLSNYNQDHQSKLILKFCWDSLTHGESYLQSLVSIDSIATILGNKNFNYVFLSEMDQEACLSFINRNKLSFKNFIFLGNMDDFISPAYKNCFERNGNSNLKFKSKPFYFILDRNGKIIHGGANKYILNDDIFINALFRTNDSLNKQIR